ncbi:hypothetical protein D3870_02650 [Noviherbaspirillum cavernae]|uniref:Leucine-binding protein domain-containing protein n=1 Tax=Noviherbaspirillum cavernae TaxID=2320862 RepID=A0A418WY67_9BURK|nr:ABC transporter substrate-binding protein [Noviherbaspirillum cavernae]RJG05063.1 hypothetical protein D3870_02650 [Noviherbaspirillum cavernae]
MIASARKVLCYASLFTAMAGTAPAWADINIAHVTPMSGPIGVEGREYDIGINVAIAAINAEGGIAGNKLVVRTEDDEYKPEKRISIIRSLARTDTVAMLSPIGSPAMTKVLQDKVLEETGIPVVGVIPGAEPLRHPLNPYLFHVRAGDADQYRKLVRNALTIGLNRIAVVYADIPFGKSGLAMIESMLKEQKLEVAVRAPIPVASNTDYSATLSLLEKTQPNLVVMVIPAQIAGEFLRAYRDRGLKMQLTTPSYGNPDTLCNVATAARARGVSVAQVMPNIRNTTLPIVRSYQTELKKYGPKDAKPNVLQFEGYVTVKVLAEGLRRINGTPTRKSLIAALESMRKTDIGGFVVDYSPTKHTGSEFVDIGIISNDCKLMF